MAQNFTFPTPKNNVIRLITPVDVRLKIVEALSVGAIDSEVARAAYADTNDASATELTFIFERLDSLIAGHFRACEGVQDVDEIRLFL
jgi:hypothetical protein